MHTLWKGSISFGLVNVPVKMHAATESQEFQFNFLHKTCQSRIRSIKKCPSCDLEVDAADLVKGYEYEKDRYVILKDEDLASLEQPMSRSIDILDFIDLKEIDPIYYQKSYYLSPEETAQKAYRLLCQAMEESGKVALARVTMRSKQHLACLRVFEEGLVMETMYYPKEIRHMDSVGEHVVPTEEELSMARQLIDHLARPFKPEKYRDELHEQMVLLIESKVAGENYKVMAPAKGRNVVDLMDALRASIAQTEKEKGPVKNKANNTIEKVKGHAVTVDINESVKDLEKPKSSLTPRKKKSKSAKEA